jgi:formate hydrogenlyase transcriptional activator
MVGPTDSTVLITGETGTGKELLARAVHDASKRSSGPFKAINCGAISPALIASELFGHEKGAFTGAFNRRLGRFEAAQGGTIFLDEIGEIPPEIQIALLRVLQEREFERVGGTEMVRVNVRIIAATHRDLNAAILEGKFRSDLFYRLNVFPLEVPPLRDRREDVSALADFFVERLSGPLGKSITRIDADSLRILKEHSWPGNIRELQNVIERSIITCEGDTLTIDERYFRKDPIIPPTKIGCLATAIADHERTIIEEALRECRGRVSGPCGAAARLGVPASTLDSKILFLKIDKHRFKSKPIRRVPEVTMASS